MLSLANEFQYESDRDESPGRETPPPAPVVGPLPAELVLTERAAAALRAYLSGAGLRHYRIFSGVEDVHDVEDHLDALGECAAWEAAGPMIGGGEPVHAVSFAEHGGGGRLVESGVLRLARAEVVFGRWQWINRDGYADAQSMWLCAAPSVKHYATLRNRLVAHRRAGGAAVWQVVRGHACYDTRTPRDPADADAIVLAPALRKRLDTDVIGFFGDDVAALYRALKVPYRRGVLLHGPPGNGKTSLIRYVGARLIELPVMLLRPAASFDTDDLTEVLRRWKSQAPGVLVIEDLDWLLKEVNVSTLLNLLDGIESGDGGRGLLLIATTNNPHELDPAINNRPGRFDVVIEIDRPDRALRLELLRRKLPEAAPALLETVADATDGLSFAHVLEVLRLSGFAAIAAGRTRRTEADLLAACATVKACNDEARRGFPAKLDVPFGLVHRRNA